MWITLYSMYFKVTSVNLKENKRDLNIFILPIGLSSCRTIGLSDWRSNPQYLMSLSSLKRYWKRWMYHWSVLKYWIIIFITSANFWHNNPLRYVYFRIPWINVYRRTFFVIHDFRFCKKKIILKIYYFCVLTVMHLYNMSEM